MEDQRSKKRADMFMEVTIKDPIRKAEAFMVSLRKKRHQERSFKKRGIWKIYEKTSGGHAQFFSFSEVKNKPEYTKYQIQENEIEEFHDDANHAASRAEMGDKTKVNGAFIDLFRVVDGAKLEEEQDQRDCLCMLLRVLCVLNISIRHLKPQDVDVHIPEIIGYIEKFNTFPGHLKQVLGILLAISAFDVICKDFFHEKYNFLSMMKDFFAEPREPETSIIAHMLLGNLICENKEMRDTLLREQFLDHLYFMYSEENLSDSDLDCMSYIVRCYFSHEVTSSEFYQYFDKLLPVFDGLLHSYENDCIENILRSRCILMQHLDPTSGFYQDLCSHEVLKKILEIFKKTQTSTKTCLEYFAKACRGGDHIIETLIDLDICDSLADVPLYGKDDAESAFLNCIFELSQTTPKNMASLCDAEVFTNVCDYLKSVEIQKQLKALRILLLASTKLDTLSNNDLFHDCNQYLLQVLDFNGSDPSAVGLTLQLLLALLDNSSDNLSDSRSQTRQRQLSEAEEKFDENGGITILEDLLNSVSPDDQDIIDKILDRYFVEGIEIEEPHTDEVSHERTIFLIDPHSGIIL
ncbi:unnamed protein product [Moneuplotes crassus]|uniref:Uncharacterized protein n=1 Tax=Euplotes crassus TaxID=5936 RepID=A0AAD1U9C5_EUPCR|nr:unnamed protein product [Moneuplotes crassus]